MEIDDKDKNHQTRHECCRFRRCARVLTQIVKERLTDKDGKIDGKVIAMDILPMEPIEGVHFLQGRLPRAGSRRQANRSLGRGEGRRRSLRYGPELVRCCRGRRPPAACSLNELALDFAKENLKKNGSLFCKVFQGSGYSQYVEACKKLLERFPWKARGLQKFFRQKCILLRVI